MKFLRNFVFIVLAVFFVGCAKVDSNLKVGVSKQANPWTHLNLYNEPDNFQFAIVSDQTGSHRPGVFADAVDKLNLLKPEFVISIGDLIEGYSEDEAILDKQWDEFDGLVNKLQMPFFYVPGNHDISNEVMAKKWHRRLGPSYYHFIYHNVLFLCLNTEDPFHYGISDQQVQYFRKVLEANPPGRVSWTLVFMHEPVWKTGRNGQPALWGGEPVWRTGKGHENWQKFESLLADRPYTVFAGHLHTYNKSIRKGRRYYILAATGGCGGGEGGELLGLAKCQFDHIVWVTMTDDGPVMANLLLEGILDDKPCPQ